MRSGHATSDVLVKDVEVGRDDVVVVVAVAAATCIADTKRNFG